ncbi:hypothetical protein L195_g010827 [Trifolium pratense]|uniref:Uncharacterized protein n=2 Tax=Trifolium pratense TaxID=57577 RepID=A0A2K3PFS6_TRIPR|nr:hypothetical protein L195_g004160 [Trifolium pratense]PNY14153.1 hypothetical protein L195_g010827 [Trifolium pratense]
MSWTDVSGRPPLFGLCPEFRAGGQLGQLLAQSRTGAPQVIASRHKTILACLREEYLYLARKFPHVIARRISHGGTFFLLAIGAALILLVWNCFARLYEFLDTNCREGTLWTVSLARNLRLCVTMRRNHCRISMESSRSVSSVRSDMKRQAFRLLMPRERKLILKFHSLSFHFAAAITFSWFYSSSHISPLSFIKVPFLEKLQPLFLNKVLSFEHHRVLVVGGVLWFVEDAFWCLVVVKPLPNAVVTPAFGRGQRPRPNVFRMSEIEGIPESHASSKHKLVDTITDPRLAWVASEPRGIASTLTAHDPKLYIVVEDNS